MSTYQFDVKLSHQNKIAAGRGLARRRMPYFSAALFSLMPRPLEGMMARVGAALSVTPRGIMYYDPHVVENEWDLEDVEFGMLHEVGHLLRDHAKRCEENSYDAETWNLAGDAAINDDLVLAGCKPLTSDMMPNKIIDPSTGAPMRDGLPEESYYAALRRQPKGEGGKGSNGRRPGAGKCGGVSGNPTDGLPEDGPLSQASGGRSAAEVERIKKQVAGAIQEHVKQHGAGSVPGGWKVWGDLQLTPPKIRWQDKLRRAVRASVAKTKGLVDYHYSRPSRRQWALGYSRGAPILPSMFAPQPRLGVFVDTSGSMGPDDLQLAMSEVSGVLKSSGAEVLFGVCDAQVHGIRKVRDPLTACKMLTGGGGTNFVPVFTELFNMPREHRPHVVVFLTDGDGPAPEHAPDGIHVIWVLVGSHACVPYSRRGKPVSWGEQIFVNND